MSPTTFRQRLALFALVLIWNVPAFAQGDPAANQTPAPSADLPAFIPQLTDEDRRAAFPDVEGHSMSGNALHSLLLFDQLEWQGRKGTAAGFTLNSRAWIGRDRDRLWIRAEGDGQAGGVSDARAHAVYGRQFSRWWDMVAGIRQDFRPGAAQTWAAFGVQGLAPYWFEIEATGYVGPSWRTQARFEVEYELLLTNRLILQPRVEADIFGKSDPARALGAGLGTTDIGFRMRYEWRREFAPYVGITWNRKWGETGDLAVAAGERRREARFVTGLRLWF